MIDYKNIKIAFFDCDGTLTDGIYSVSEAGEISKNFYTRDFHGLQMLIESGVKVLIITQASDKVISSQMQRIIDTSPKWKMFYSEGLFDLKKNCCNKKDFIQNFLDKKGLSWYDVTYMGDAENDLLPMEYAVLTACPNDAIDEIKKNSNFVAEKDGGKGAVYEFCKYLIDKRSK